MRYLIKLKPVLCLSCLGILLYGASASAQSEMQGPPENSSKVENNVAGPQESTETPPSYKGSGSMYLGFRLVDFDDFSRAMRYEDGDSSLVLGIEGLACPLPHRYHMQVEYFGKHNYYGDIGYAYRDLLLFRNILTGIHHNLAHYYYLYPAAPGISYDDRSIGDENFVDFTKNEFLLRLKAPDFPLHTFVKHRYVEQDGALEKRFLLGSFGNLTKVSQTRDIDWQSTDLTLGLNSHLGPVEMEYAHSLGEFDPGNESVLYDYFPFSFSSQRPGDTYPHNVVPETDFSANFLKLHTSYTGQLVASATFSNAKNTNNYSGAESEAWKAALELRWMPDPVISLFFKYRHREQDKDNPDQVMLKGLVNQLTYTVRPPVSTKKDTFSLSARYRPLGILTLIGNYAFERRQRTDIDQWVMLPENSDIHRATLTAQARPLDTLKLKAIYDYRYYENPSYNTEPDQSNKVRLNATYTPTTWLTALLDCSRTLTQRDDLRYLNSVPRLVLSDGERDGTSDHFLGSLSFVFSPEVSLTASWAYNKWKVEQDLAYALWNTAGPGGDLPYYDRGVSYDDDANTLSLSLYYKLRKDLTLTADVSYTFAEAGPI